MGERISYLKNITIFFIFSFFLKKGLYFLAKNEQKQLIFGIPYSNFVDFLRWFIFVIKTLHSIETKFINFILRENTLGYKKIRIFLYFAFFEKKMLEFLKKITNNDPKREYLSFYTWFSIILKGALFFLLNYNIQDKQSLDTLFHSASSTY